MSTQAVTPQLSPIEQLMGSQPTSSSQPQGQGDLSPIEQLMGSNPNNTPPSADGNYLKQVNTDPFSPAGQAEKAMGAGMTNAEQARQAARVTGQAALQTAGGVVGAGVAGMSLDAAAPLVTTLAEHLPTLDKAYKILTALGAGTYTVQHLKDVMKIIGGGK